MSNQDFYPLTVPADPRRPIRVLFRVNAAPEEIRQWYFRTLESLKSQRSRDDEVLHAAYGESWGGTPRPARAQLLRPEPLPDPDGAEMVAHELFDVTRLDFHPGAGGTTVEARCWGGLPRRTFDAVLATAADTFPESRGDLQRAAAEFRLPDLSKALERRVPAGNSEEPAAVPAGNGVNQEDEDIRLARVAHEYSSRGAGGVKPGTIELWEKIVELKRLRLDHSTIAARLSIPLDTFNYHKRKMKKSGYWRDNELD